MSQAASQIVPALEPRPGAPRGTFEQIAIDKALDLIEANDLILSREVAPAVAVQTYLDDRLTAAFVDDQDRWTQPNSLLRYYQKQNTPSADLEKVLSDDVTRAEASGGAAERIDAIKALLFIIGGQSGDYHDYGAAVDRVFKPRDGAVRCLTIHKAKGLEAERVFLIRPDLLPHRYAQRDWQREQEENLLYVALTRAKDKLFICQGEVPVRATAVASEIKQSTTRKSYGIWGTGFSRLRGQPLPVVSLDSVAPPPASHLPQHDFHGGICVSCGKAENLARRFRWSCD
jgi:hypothetical protein